MNLSERMSIVCVFLLEVKYSLDDFHLSIYKCNTSICRQVEVKYFGTEGVKLSAIFLLGNKI